MTLALIRHVTPLIDRGVCDAAEAARRAILYDTTQSLALWQTDKFKISAAQEKLARISRVYSSPLPRAALTAQKLFLQRSIEYLEALREFNLRIFPVPLIKMPFDCWLVLSRLLWLCGMNPSGASAKAERRRALDLMPSLLEADTAVIAHGFVLRVIRRSARRAGYGLIYRFCEGCFCVEIWRRLRKAEFSYHLQGAKFTCRLRKLEFARRKFVAACEIMAYSPQIGALRETFNLASRFAFSCRNKAAPVKAIPRAA